MAAINSLKAFQREHKDHCSRGDGFMLDPRLLKLQSGFNVRDYSDPEVREHIGNLKQAYISGDYVPPIIISVIDGEVLVREGHCRTLALQQAIQEGHDIKRIRVEEHRGDEVAQTSLILTSNDGLKLKALQRAEVYQRLKAYGLTDTEIARKVGRTPQHVAQYLTMLQMPVELKQMVNEGKMSATCALDLFNGEGASGAVQKASEGLQAAEKQGKDKVTAKTLNGQKRLSPKAVTEIREALVSVHELFAGTEVPDDYQGNLKVTMTVDQFRSIKQAAAVAKEYDNA